MSRRKTTHKITCNHLQCFGRLHTVEHANFST